MASVFYSEVSTRRVFYTESLFCPVDSFPWLDYILRPFVSQSLLIKCVRKLQRIAKVIVSQRRENLSPQKVCA